jgi:hypothetical protein
MTPDEQKSAAGSVFPSFLCPEDNSKKRAMAARGRDLAHTSFHCDYS